MTTPGNCSLCNKSLVTTDRQDVAAGTCFHSFHRKCIEKRIADEKSTDCPKCDKPIILKNKTVCKFGSVFVWKYNFLFYSPVTIVVGMMMTTMMIMTINHNQNYHVGIKQRIMNGNVMSVSMLIKTRIPFAKTADIASNKKVVEDFHPLQKFLPHLRNIIHLHHHR